jgi:hypothetical protein
MANGLLKKIGKNVRNIAATSALGLAALLPNQAKSVPIAWNSFSDIVDNGTDYGAQVVNYSANSINFKDQNGNTIQNNPAFSLIYFAAFPEYGGISLPVGGLDGSVKSASGWFNSNVEWAFPGMKEGQTANYTEGNWDNGVWKMFVDVNGNGSYGTYDPSNGLFVPEAGEFITDPRVANFSPFHVRQGTLSAGDIGGWYTPIPEPSSLALLGVGAATLGATAFRRRFSKRDKKSSGSN